MEHFSHNHVQRYKKNRYLCTMISKNQIKYIRQLELKKFRKREGIFVAEGPKVVGDLLRADFQPCQLFATADWNDSDYEIVEVTDDELRKISFLQHPQQVLGVFRIKNTVDIEPSPLRLALDGVQDPGNLGTIIRIADWFGFTTIYCSEDTVDAWNPKVVQATMGSIARVNIIYTDLKELIQTAEMPVYGTLLDGDNIYEQPLSSKGIVVMGNEGNGISEPIRQLITQRLLIPQFHEGPESLNVAIATAITCSEFKRRN
jgi:TrmH family RNA methyltransferase